MTGWFRCNQKTLEFITRHSGRRIVEPFSGSEPLFDRLSYDWAVAVEKEMVPGRSDIECGLLQDWIPLNVHRIACADTFIMAYPPNYDCSPHDATLAMMLGGHQRLILCAPRPWGNMTVAGSTRLWQHVKNKMHVEAIHDCENQNGDFVYVLRNTVDAGMRNGESIFQGHEVWAL